MRQKTFAIMVRKDEPGRGFYAYCPRLPGCFSNGRTKAEARRNMREAIRLHVESLREHDAPPRGSL